MKGIRAVVAELEKSPTGNLLIVGHTDSVAGDVENLGLSVDRAEAVKAYLKNDVHAWECFFDKSEKDKTRWADRERTQMISALPCEPSVTGFQAFSNETRGTSLALDGKFGTATRRALIEAYMALGGTRLPEHIGIAVHGCGEFFPAEDVGDGVEDEENRRVEMFCFDEQIDPPVPGKKAKRGEPQYSQWNKQVTKDIDISTDSALVTIRIRLVDRAGIPKEGTTYRLVVGDVDVEGVTDHEGMLVHEVPANVRTGQLTYEGFTRTLRIGDMAEPRAASGAQPRLRNLGFGAGNATKAPSTP